MDIDRTRRSSRAEESALEQASSSAEASPAHARPLAREISPDRIAASADHDAVLVEMARAARLACVSAPPRRDDGILYIGANGADASESGALRAHGSVTVARHGDAIVHRGQRFDLSTPSGRELFVRSLHLDRARANELEGLLDRSGARAEIASLAIALHGAEEGRAVPSRIVLSGLGGHESLYGDRDDGPDIDFAEVRRCASLFPEGASLVEDVAIAAPFSAHEVNREHASWLHAFPKLKTMWAYDGAAPSAAQMRTHLAAWATATRGATDRLAAGPELRSSNVAVWSRAGGYHTNAWRDSATERGRDAAAAIALGDVERWRAGDTALGAGSYGDAALEFDYEALMRKADQSTVSSAERRHCLAQAEVLLQIRQWDAPTDAVRDRVAAQLGPRLGEAFRAAGLTAPDVAKMTRAEALAAFRALDSNAHGDVRARYADVIDALDRALHPKPLGEWTIREAGY
jgi:hypothetical protein